MRERRGALGLTVRQVAVRVGLKESSASYLSQIESGAKTPHAALARRLAAALDDDPRIYLAWAATGKRSDPVETARAVQVLAETLGHAKYAGLAAGGGPPSRPAPRRLTESVVATEVETGALERAQPLPGAADHYRDTFSRELPGVPPAPPVAEVPQARILVPEITEGTDPGDGSRAGP
jgi:transcriptional regulator with XRE-family HTH domain